MKIKTFTDILVSLLPLSVFHPILEITIKSISFGKYNISKNYKIVPQKSRINYLDEAIVNDIVTESQEICDIYNNIKNSVLDKYLD